MNRHAFLQIVLDIRPIMMKEMRQIFRDVRQLFVLIFMPAFLLLIFGYALNFDVKHVRLGVYDGDRSSASAELIKALTRSEYVEYSGTISAYSEVDRMIEDMTLQAILVIPENYSRELEAGKIVKVQIIVDGANPTVGSNALAYVAMGVIEHSNRIQFQFLERYGRNILSPVKLEHRILYNPELESAKFLVPGLFGLILMIVTVISTSLSIVREKEMGTMEQMKISPLHASSIIIGKIIPYYFIALAASIVIMVLGFFLFGIVIRGNLFSLFIILSLYLIAGLGQGLLISTITHTQQIAFMISIFSSLLPAFILSGFIFPISSMPLFLQIVASIFPVRYFLELVRGVMLKGTPLFDLYEPLLALLFFTLFLVSISIMRLRKELAS